jgi:hypothetical protein
VPRHEPSLDLSRGCLGELVGDKDARGDLQVEGSRGGEIEVEALRAREGGDGREKKKKKKEEEERKKGKTRTLKAASDLAACSLIEASTPSTFAPAASTTAAATTSPYFSSGAPKETASATAGCDSSAPSTSIGEIFSPPRLMSSFSLPVKVT